MHALIDELWVKVAVEWQTPVVTERNCRAGTVVLLALSLPCQKQDGKEKKKLLHHLQDDIVIMWRSFLNVSFSSFFKLQFAFKVVSV